MRAANRQIISHITGPNNLPPSLHLAARTLAGVVKEVLLRVAAVIAEIRLAKRAELLRRHLAFPGKIFLFQDALDPDIDRKRAQPLVGEEHHAISDFRADAGQLAESGPQGFVGKYAPLLEISLAGRDQTRGREKVFRPVTEGAFSQILLGQLRDLSQASGKRMDFAIEDR